ncbi:hypothetical protein P8629_02860 [Hydrogenovibrio sp. 3SP14C1]|uniref:hypothetical protein n=1 Tax=Hydrogenovibrio sp. 3SP14C1 TaxID=3038774 RepID=UPI0024176D1B|nr:hypothetical protein [Hydrogenovibrio sp. 3SP14C1]MDG4811938.1 hypothetical protein [Hydrogenovibrio sp. 3SP14C1]
MNKRLKKFKSELIKEIPFFPNNRETKESLESESLSGVLLAYLNWKSRQIRPAIRKSLISPNVTASPHWQIYKEQINDIIDKSNRGEDLNPYLSLQAHDKGYTIIGRDDDQWLDKDQILNTKGLYHFHLSSVQMPRGHMDRTNELLFAYVTHDTFQTLGIFTHSVFEHLENGEPHPERLELLKAHDKVIKFNTPPNSVFIDNPIMMSGHTLNVVSMVQDYTYIVDNNDPKLNDHEFLTKLFMGNLPEKYKLSWAMDFTRLGLYDSLSGTFFILRHGLN